MLYNLVNVNCLILKLPLNTKTNKDPAPLNKLFKASGVDVTILHPQ